MGCTLAQPGEYYWTVRLRRRCGLFRLRRHWCAVDHTCVLLSRKDTVWTILSAEDWSTSEIQARPTTVWLCVWPRERYVASCYRDGVSTDQTVVQSTISDWGGQLIPMSWLTHVVTVMSFLHTVSMPAWFLHYASSAKCLLLWHHFLSKIVIIRTFFKPADSILFK